MKVEMVPVPEHLKSPMTAFDWLWELNMVCGGFFSTEKPKQKASNSELRRWFEKSSVLINGQRMKSTDLVEKVETIVLFPKSEKQKRTYDFTI